MNISFSNSRSCENHENIWIFKLLICLFIIYSEVNGEWLYFANALENPFHENCISYERIGGRKKTHTHKFARLCCMRFINFLFHQPKFVVNRMKLALKYMWHTLHFIQQQHQHQHHHKTPDGMLLIDSVPYFDVQRPTKYFIQSKIIRTDL